MIQNASGTGHVEGKVDNVAIGGKPLELSSNEIVNDGSGSWVVTKTYGRIRVSGGSYGMVVWLTPSQKARLKALFLETKK